MTESPIGVFDSGVGGLTVARAVIDASGTYAMANPLGSNGLAAVGEPECRAQIFYGIPDVLGSARERYAGRAVAVVGSGHSAFNALLELARLGEIAPATTITWVVRRDDVAGAYGGGVADALPARGNLGARLRTLVDAGRIWPCSVSSGSISIRRSSAPEPWPPSSTRTCTAAGRCPRTGPTSYATPSRASTSWA